MTREKYQHSAYYQAKKWLTGNCGEVEARVQPGRAAAVRAGRPAATCAKVNRFTVKKADSNGAFGTIELAYTAAFFRFAQGNLHNADWTDFHGLPYCLAMDLAVAMKRDLKRIKDAAYHALVKKELRKAIAQLRRDQFAERERARRRELAAARRKIAKRTTTSPMPDPEDLLAAWERRKDSPEAVIRLGGMLEDLECYVDNRLKINEFDRIVGRNGGIKGWLHACLPELEPHYKRLMQYKALAKKLRQATETHDPKPTAALLTDEPRPRVVLEILRCSNFFKIEKVLEKYLSPEAVGECEAVVGLNEEVGEVCEGAEGKIDRGWVI